MLKSRAWYEADAEGKVILITLLLRACHAPTLWPTIRGKTVPLLPGELWISYRHFAKACGVTLKKVRSEIQRLTAAGFLICTARREGTVAHIVNWNAYQAGEGTLKGTPMGTPPEEAFPLDICGSSASPKAPKGTPKGTLKGTLNKNVISSINNINNNLQLPEAEPQSAFQLALQEYAQDFPLKDTALDAEILKALHSIAASSGTVWILKAVRELKAVSAEKHVRSPQRYLLGIIANWQRDGIIDTRRADQKELLDFYEQEGAK